MNMATATAEAPTETTPKRKRKGRAKFTIILQKDMADHPEDEGNPPDFRDIPEASPFKSDTEAFASIKPGDDGHYRTINVRAVKIAETVKSVQLSS